MKRWNEPTWGDCDKILKVVNGLKPANCTQLLNGFGTNLIGPKHLQLVRNAAIHPSGDTLQALAAIHSQYKTRTYSHPTEFVWLIRKADNTEAVYSWIDDLDRIAELVTA